MTALPRLLILTDRRRAQARGRTLVETIEAAVQGGARAVVLRERDLPVEERLQLGRALLEVVEGGMLIVASDPALALHLGASAVHLASSDPWDIPDGLLVGRSCHDAGELAEAARRHADYATLSPVFPSLSKPGYGPSLGAEGLARLVGPELPHFALGGISPGRVQACLEAGAYGVAVMGAVMSAERPAQVTARLVAEAQELRREVPT
ncbi:MAG: thiamine phosphate synthase [Acidimicrobiia bacterium]